MSTTRFRRGASSASNTSDAVHEAAEAALAEGDNIEDVALGVVMTSPSYDIPEVIDVLGTRLPSVPLIGSTTAGEFTDEGVTEGGLVIALIVSERLSVASAVADGVSEDVFGTVQATVNNLPAVGDMDGEHVAAITFHDGLTGKGEEIALLTRQLLGGVPLVGGSAGDDLNLAETTVFTDSGASSDGVAIALLAAEEPFGLAAKHGHTTLSDTYEVTRADANVVHELDGEPAFEVWQREVAKTARDTYAIDVDDLDPSDDRFAILLTQFELGLKTKDGGYKIRWPGMTNSTDGPLTFATGVPEGSEVRVMHSPKDEQINSAREAAQASLAHFEGEDVAGALVFDCVCRGLILEDEFGTAVDAIASELESPLAGFETYGEISMPSEAATGYHNTTTSILLFPA
ncbi:FIST signal transduction protein [Halovenus rubra]|uniref:FIST signal transduction protein n=2 Tax=Halovenus rubra TaxID=869890 RepID=A0ABD5X8D0_9EURY|nr:FIST N-terminal domain-containing protein [Halovenus rubra]